MSEIRLRQNLRSRKVIGRALVIAAALVTLATASNLAITEPTLVTAQEPVNMRLAFGKTGRSSGNKMAVLLNGITPAASWR